MKVQLTHYSYHPAARGMPGDVVDAPEALARVWLKTGGAKPVGASAPHTAPAPANDQEGDVESGDQPPEEPPAEGADDKPKTDESKPEEPKPSRRRR